MTSDDVKVGMGGTKERYRCSRPRSSPLTFIFLRDCRVLVAPYQIVESILEAIGKREYNNEYGDAAAHFPENVLSAQQIMIVGKVHPKI